MIASAFAQRTKEEVLKPELKLTSSARAVIEALQARSPMTIDELAHEACLTRECSISGALRACDMGYAAMRGVKVAVTKRGKAWRRAVTTRKPGTITESKGIATVLALNISMQWAPTPDKLIAEHWLHRGM